MTVTKKAYAKINLTLEILGTRRGDGFHDIASVMHKVESLYDEVTVARTPSGIAFVCDADVCPPDKNLAYRAAAGYFERCTEKGVPAGSGVSISLKKKIPAQAGLAGGSSDAAAVLAALDELYGALDETELSALALSLGSDVPFCFHKSLCALCTGRGEKIAPLPPMRQVSVVVRFPDAPLSTAGIYAEYDRLYGDDYTKEKSVHMARTLERGGSFEELAQNLCNDFQALCERRCPAIAETRARLAAQGYVSQMTGSGSAVFGLMPAR